MVPIRPTLKEQYMTDQVNIQDDDSAAREAIAARVLGTPPQDTLPGLAHDELDRLTAARDAVQDRLTDLRAEKFKLSTDIKMLVDDSAALGKAIGALSRHYKMNP